MSFIVVVVVVFVIGFIVIIVAILTAAVAHRSQYCLITFALQFFFLSLFLINQEHESIFYHASQTHGSIFIFSSFTWHFHHVTNFPSIFYLIFFPLSCFFFIVHNFSIKIKLFLTQFLIRTIVCIPYFSLFLSLSIFTERMRKRVCRIRSVSSKCCLWLFWNFSFVGLHYIL